MKRLIRLICAALLVCWPTAAPAAKDTKSAGIEQELKKERGRLKQLNAEIEQTRKKAKKAERKSESVLKRIETLDKKLSTKRREYRSIAKDIKAKDRQLADIEQQRAEADDALSAHQEAIAGRLRLLYMEGRDGYLKTLFATDSLSRLDRRLAYLSMISKHEHTVIASYRTQLETYQTLRAEQLGARDELLALQRQTQQAINDMKGIKKDKRTILTSLSKEQETYQRAVEDLERSAKQVDALLKELDQRFKLAQSKPKRRSKKAHAARSLLWPAQGTVVSFFGRQKHPTFDTYVNKKGIEIKTRKGTPIRAVSAGAVVYADWLKGYGLVTIVDHENGFFSLYAHASKLLVKEGQTIDVGDAIGATGSTGLTDANILYFELRKGTQPVDPLRWLVKRP